MKCVLNVLAHKHFRYNIMYIGYLYLLYNVACGIVTDWWIVLDLPWSSHFLFSSSTLDLSFNKIREIKNITCLVNLVNLYLVNNKINKIQNLAPLTNLVMLELGSNRIRVSVPIIALGKLLSKLHSKRVVKLLRLSQTVSKLNCNNVKLVLYLKLWIVK